MQKKGGYLGFMKKLTCASENQHQYDIYIQKGIKDHIYNMEAIFGRYKNIVIITDKNSGKYYLGVIKKQLKAYGGNVYSIVIPSGEQTKNLETVQSIYNELLGFGITRGDLIVALGGGVVGDIAGFVSGTYMRGMDFVQIPTTILAQVDSSVGGKCGVNLAGGKNLVGLLHHPRAVIIDPLFLETLDDHYLMDGMAEVIKYGCISSGKLFVRLLSYQYQEDLLEDMEEIVAKCVQIKRNIVEKDVDEKGVRRILNFGHTMGHVIETYFDFQTYSHGEAVAIGMYNMTKMTCKEGITKREDLDNLGIILETYGLPTEMPQMDMQRVEEILMRDKKLEGDILNLCVMPKIGEAEIVKMRREKAIQLFMQ